VQAEGHPISSSPVPNEEKAAKASTAIYETLVRELLAQLREPSGSSAIEQGGSHEGVPRTQFKPLEKETLMLMHEKALLEAELEKTAFIRRNERYRQMRRESFLRITIALAISAGLLALGLYLLFTFAVTLRDSPRSYSTDLLAIFVTATSVVAGLFSILRALRALLEMPGQERR
jgi:hypothetical protein